MSFDLRSADLEAINSATKYPSIPTYHQLGDRGSLTDAVTEFQGPVIGTEKVDGTNARVISLPDGSWLLGSREELLCAKGDLIGNPAQGIVAALREFANTLTPVDGVVRVFYLEVYGGKITAASKQYTGDRAVGYRLFDMMVLRDYEAVSAMPVPEISAWRESGGQPFLAETELAAAAVRGGVELTPRLFTLDCADLPREIDTTREFLAAHLPVTRSALDDGAAGRPEGIVLRTLDRSAIAKARFEDYDRTLRRRRPAAG
ncbi:RNA ligase family protein [Nocardia sp. NBC_01730]|uniref:RNA ligase family protein n=1 Tax=Nocardia sp. NBC_01730 TaxID=2975998 RepID=UPI002E127B3A|nr:RNA ligase family protein [Nocardia sp. NBC_01730]